MEKLYSKITKVINNRKTLLGVGPMSLNVVDSAIELADKFKTPIMLIPSRRQMESEILLHEYLASLEMYKVYLSFKKNHVIELQC